MHVDENSEPPVVPPPPRMKGGELPDIDQEYPPTHWQETTYEIDHNQGTPPDYMEVDHPELSHLAPAALFELNQAAIDDAVPDRPLIAPLAHMTILRVEYENGNQIFVQQIDWLMQQGYVGIRRARGDGDCFYRSLAYAYIERVLNAPDQAMAAVQAVSTLEATQSMLETVGFQPLVFEDFLETFTSVIKRIAEAPPGEPLLTPSGKNQLGIDTYV